MNAKQSSEFTDILVKMYQERDRQLIKHGDQSHLPDGVGPHQTVVGDLFNYLPQLPAVPENIHLENAARRRCQAASQNEGGDGTITKEMILTEEWAEALSAETPQELKKELIQIATVAAWWAAGIEE